MDRQKSEVESQLAEMGPGAVLEVSNVLGRGYASLFNSYVGLLSAMEESRPLLLIGDFKPSAISSHACTARRQVALYQAMHANSLTQA